MPTIEMDNESPSSIETVKMRKIDIDKKLDLIEEDLVAVESPIRFFLNRKPLTTIMASPSNLSEMALGFLVDEGVVPHYKCIREIKINKNEVKVKAKEVNQERLKSISENALIVTSCGSKADFYRVIDELDKRPLKKNYHIKAQDIADMVRETINKSSSARAIFHITGGVHSASVFNDKILRGFAEDVGRHNAVDKAIGICLEKNVPLDRAILITSGRQTADIIMKAARCKIPISVSIRAPILTGIYAAELAGITLICFVRGSKMNIYSHPERVKPLNQLF